MFTVNVTPKRDSDNTRPETVEIYDNDDGIVFKLSWPDRRLEFHKEDLQKILPLLAVSSSDSH